MHIQVGQVRGHPKKKGQQLLVKNVVLDTDKGTLFWDCEVLFDSSDDGCHHTLQVSDESLKAAPIITAPTEVVALARGQVRQIEVVKGPPHLVWLDREIPPGDTWVVFHAGSEKRDLYYSVLLAGSRRVDLAAYSAKREASL